jgi:hypothetical protein
VIADGDVAAAADSAVKAIREGMNTLAEELVTSGKAKAEIARVGETMMPDLTAKVLVGREIEMVFKIKEKVNATRRKRHVYRGSAISVVKCPQYPTVAPKMAKRKRKGKGGKRKRTNTEPDVVPPPSAHGGDGSDDMHSDGDVPLADLLKSKRAHASDVGASAAPSGQKRARASEGNVGDSATAKRRTCEGSGSGAGLLTQAVVKWQGEDEPTAALLHPEFYAELKK